MFKCFAVLSVLLVTAGWLPQSPAPAETDKSCKEHPLLVGKCFTVHGRLTVYNGAPALRIWKVGTRRMLGVSEQRFSVPGYRNVPEDLQTQINQDTALWGDYVVCPFTRPRSGEMQLVCIEKGKNLIAQKLE